VRHRFAFSLASALRSTASAAGRPALFGGFIAVESGEVGLIALPPPARSNGSCSFPASRFPMWVALIGEGWFLRHPMALPRSPQCRRRVFRRANLSALPSCTHQAFIT